MTIVFLILGLSLPLTAAERVINVPVVDKSPAWSPLAISGTVHFTEQVVANAVTSASNYEVSARNISAKDIVLIVATFDEASSSPAGGVHHVIEIDRIFSPIQPGESFILNRRPPGITTSYCCVNPLEAPAQATADLTVEYIQCTDGSSLGDASKAQEC
jgi:hypothetical protein